MQAICDGTMLLLSVTHPNWLLQISRLTIGAKVICQF